MRFKLFAIFDMLFRLVLIFLIAFVWIRFYVDSLSLAIFITSIVTLVVDFVIKIFSSRRDEKQKLKEEELKKIDIYANTFIFNDDKFCVDFFYKLAKTRHNAIKKKEYVLIEHDSGEKVVLFPYYTFRKFNTDDLVFTLNSIKNLQANKLVLCTNDFENDALKFANMVGKKIILLNKKQVYLKLLKEYNFFPQEKLIELKTTQKNKIKELLSFSLSRKKTKGYFLASVVLLLSSFIMRYNIYYIVMSSILLLLSLVSFISPKFSKKLPEKII